MKCLEWHDKELFMNRLTELKRPGGLRGKGSVNPNHSKDGGRYFYSEKEGTIMTLKELEDFFNSNSDRLKTSGVTDVSKLIALFQDKEEFTEINKEEYDKYFADTKIKNGTRESFEEGADVDMRNEKGIVKTRKDERNRNDVALSPEDLVHVDYREKFEIKKHKGGRVMENKRFSVRDRHQLSSLTEALKRKGVRFSIVRSKKEGYRYDVEVDGTKSFKSLKENNKHNSKFGTLLESIYDIFTDEETENLREPVTEILKEFTVNGDFVDRGFILTDGTLTSNSEMLGYINPHYKVDKHIVDLLFRMNYITEEQLDKYTRDFEIDGDLDTLLCDRLGFIRVNGLNEDYIGLPKNKPTSAQFRTLARWISAFGQERRYKDDINVMSVDGEFCSYNTMYNSGREISDKIYDYYTTGKLASGKLSDGLKDKKKLNRPILKEDESEKETGNTTERDWSKRQIKSKLAKLAQDEWEATQGYIDSVSDIDELGDCPCKKKITYVLKDIEDEEMEHIGELEYLADLVDDDSIDLIDDGREESEDNVDEVEDKDITDDDFFGIDDDFGDGEIFDKFDDSEEDEEEDDVFDFDELDTDFGDGDDISFKDLDDLYIDVDGNEADDEVTHFNFDDEEDGDLDFDDDDTDMKPETEDEESEVEDEFEDEEEIGGDEEEDEKKKSKKSDKKADKTTKKKDDKDEPNKKGKKEKSDKKKKGDK